MATNRSVIVQYEIVVTCRYCLAQNRIRLPGKRLSDPRCGKCDKLLLKIVAYVGHFYILSNTAMPQLLKIGMTTKGVDARIKELQQATGVPGKFVLEGAFPAFDPRRMEKEIHAILKPYRETGNKEFFRISIREAMLHAEKVCGCKAQKL
jgi:hypothetical protein